jgi:hypothetical protein
MMTMDGFGPRMAANMQIALERACDSFLSATKNMRLAGTSPAGFWNAPNGETERFTR